MTRRIRTGDLAVATIALAVALVACAPMDVEPAVGPEGPALTDAEIAAMVEAVNRGAVEVARLATERAESPEVRQHAQNLLEAHERTGQDLQMLLTTRQITPEQTARVRDLEEQNRRALEWLRTQEGAAFDQAFLEHDIQTHEWLLATVDEAFLPGVRDRQFRAALTDVRPALEEHLTHARTVHGQLQVDIR